MTAVQTTAKYMWLNTGEWGLLVTGDCSKGMSVIATARDGRRERHIIGKIIGRTQAHDFVCTIATAEQAKALAARPSTSFNAKKHTTRAKVRIPENINLSDIPFDPPYVKGTEPVAKAAVVITSDLPPEIETMARAIYMTHWRAPSPTWDNAGEEVQAWVRAQAMAAWAALESVWEVD